MVAQERWDVAERPVTVLLAEDEYLLRVFIADEIRQLGWKVIEVGTADEGLQIVRSKIEFDLLLTDVHMPGSLNGLDLARTVRKERPATRIAVMSGRLKPEPQFAGLFDVFIPKPATQLMTLIKGLLDSRSES